MQGFLQQRRRDGSWMQLYCRLRNGSMLFYRGVLDEKPVVTFGLKDYYVTSPDSAELIGQSFAFKLTKPGVSEHVLAAEDNKSFQKWMKALENQNLHIELNQEPDIVAEKGGGIRSFGNEVEADLKPANNKLNPDRDRVESISSKHVDIQPQSDSVYSNSSDLLLDFSSDSPDASSINLGRAFINPSAFTDNSTNNIQPAVSKSPEFNRRDQNQNDDSLLLQTLVPDYSPQTYDHQQDIIEEEEEDSFPVHFNQPLPDHKSGRDEEMKARNNRSSENLIEVMSNVEDSANLVSFNGDARAEMSEGSDGISWIHDNQNIHNAGNHLDQSSNQESITKAVKPLNKELMALFNNKNHQIEKPVKKRDESKSVDTQNSVDITATKKGSQNNNSPQKSSETSPVLTNLDNHGTMNRNPKIQATNDLVELNEETSPQVPSKYDDDREVIKSAKPLDKNLLSLFGKNKNEEKLSPDKERKSPQSTSPHLVLTNIRTDSSPEKDKKTENLTHFNGIQEVKIGNEPKTATELDMSPEFADAEEYADDYDVTKSVKPLSKNLLHMFDRKDEKNDSTSAQRDSCSSERKKEKVVIVNNSSKQTSSTITIGTKQDVSRSEDIIKSTSINPRVKNVTFNLQEELVESKKVQLVTAEPNYRSTGEAQLPATNWTSNVPQNEREDDVDGVVIKKTVKPLDKNLMNIFDRNTNENSSKVKSLAPATGVLEHSETDGNYLAQRDERQSKTSTSTSSSNITADEDLKKKPMNCDLQAAVLVLDGKTPSREEPLSAEAELSSCKDAMLSAKTLFRRLESESWETAGDLENSRFKSQKSQEEMSYFNTSQGIKIPLLKRTKSMPALNSQESQEVVTCWAGKYAEQSQEKEVLKTYNNPYLAKCRLKQKLELERKMAAKEREAAHHVEKLVQEIQDQENEKMTKYTIVRVGSYVQALPLSRSEALPRRLAAKEREHTECLRKLQEVRADIAKLQSLMNA